MSIHIERLYLDDNTGSFNYLAPDTYLAECNGCGEGYSGTRDNAEAWAEEHSEECGNVPYADADQRLGGWDNPYA